MIVGANNGWATDRPLRFAQDDARRVRAVLTQLGGVAETDATLLLEPSTQEVDKALARIEKTLAESTEPTLFFFFYSGHADSAALHLPGPALPLASLADRLAATSATLSVAVVDACRSGAMLATKGAQPVPVSLLKMAVDEPVQGFALLSSSGADELAQESKALAGSIFTHHWVSALRGAGDVDGDGAVRLSEAYAYAYERTRLDTEATALPQRPGFRFSLKGQGDVELTRLTTSSATLELNNEPSQRYVLVDSDEQHLVAEIRSDPRERRRLQLPAGSYRLKKPDTDGVWVAEFTVTSGAVVWSKALPFRKEPLERGILKGGSAFADWAANGTLAQGDIKAALDMFQRLIDEDPYESRARRGKARALLAYSTELQAQGQVAEEERALDEALALDPSFAEDPSIARFAQRARVLKDERLRRATIRRQVEAEARENPRLTRSWGVGAALLSTKGIVVLEGHWLPTSWLDVSVACDVIGPGVDISARWLPLPFAWTPYIGLGAHYGFRLWRNTSDITVNGASTGLTYDDIWGKMAHADVGVQWMSPGGFSFDVGGGPMLFLAPTGQPQLFGFINLGIAWYFH